MCLDAGHTLQAPRPALSLEGEGGAWYGLSAPFTLVLISEERNHLASAHKNQTTFFPKKCSEAHHQGKYIS